MTSQHDESRRLTASGWAVVAGVALLACIGWERHRAADLRRHRTLAVSSLMMDSMPSTAVANAGACNFIDPKSGIEFKYPAGWTPENTGTAVLDVTAPMAGKVGFAKLCLDVPSLGWHPPIIPLAMVVSGYVDDLKHKIMPDVCVQESTDVSVGGSSGRRLCCCGHVHGNVQIDDAVLIVHKGQVYILSVDCDDASAPAAKAALDQAVSSIRWTK